MSERIFKTIWCGIFTRCIAFYRVEYLSTTSEYYFSFDETQGMIAVISAIVGNCLALSMCLFYTMKWSKAIIVAA
ncbi:hypothetical protein SNF32_10045 [Enterococcus mundtii]|nr:hypothetical protein [Enterococcus mundtii]